MIKRKKLFFVAKVLCTGKIWDLGSNFSHETAFAGCWRPCYVRKVFFFLSVNQPILPFYRYKLQWINIVDKCRQIKLFDKITTIRNNIKQLVSGKISGNCYSVYPILFHSHGKDKIPYLYISYHLFIFQLNSEWTPRNTSIERRGNAEKILFLKLEESSRKTIEPRTNKEKMTNWS